MGEQRFEFPVVWKRKGIGRDLANLTRYEAQLEAAEVEVAAAYRRVEHLRAVVTSLRRLRGDGT